MKTFTTTIPGTLQALASGFKRLNVTESEVFGGASAKALIKTITVADSEIAVIYDVEGDLRTLDFIICDSREFGLNCMAFTNKEAFEALANLDQIVEQLKAALETDLPLSLLLPEIAIIFNGFIK